MSFQKQCPGLLLINHRFHHQEITWELLSTEEIVLMKTFDSMFCIKYTLWSRGKYLNNYQMDWHEIVFRHSRFPEDET